MLLIRIDYQGNKQHTHTLITPSKVCHKIKFNYCSISALRKGKLCGRGVKVNQKLNEQLVKDNSRCPQLAPRFYYTLSRQRNRWKINTPKKEEDRDRERDGEREHCEATIRQREATWIGVCRKARLGHITPPMAEIRRRRCHSKINFKSLNEMNLKKERKRLRERKGAGRFVANVKVASAHIQPGTSPRTPLPLPEHNLKGRQVLMRLVLIF